MSGIAVHLVKRALLSAFYLLFIIVLLITTWMVAAESLNEWVLSLAKWRNVMPEFLMFNLMYRVPAIPHPEVFLGKYLPSFTDIKDLVGYQKVPEITTDERRWPRYHSGGRLLTFIRCPGFALTCTSVDIGQGFELSPSAGQQHHQSSRSYEDSSETHGEDHKTHTYLA